ncbi:MAG: hypothetical protein KatS3mg104_3131 [Phycisphaerae bacterium]|nr:MAG: hypothetical protein KatS3mg104_3131 [Phycisphaerae bacterium]
MELIRQNLLTTIIFLTAFRGLCSVLLVRDIRVIRGITLGVSLGVLGLCLMLLIPSIFDRTGSGIYAYEDQGGVVQLVQRLTWIPAIRAEYLVGVDGLSMPLVVLSALVFVLSVLAGWKTEKLPRGFFFVDPASGVRRHGVVPGAGFSSVFRVFSRFHFFRCIF